MKKTPYCIYDKDFNLESGVGALRIYLPSGNGFVNYNIVHSVREDRVCDTWRLSQAFALNSNLEKPFLLSPHAEWDMALHIKNRDDFIGGELHGDEIFTNMRLFLDGCEKSAEKITELIEFSTITVQVESIGYDPSDHKTEALRHFKEYTVTASGIAIDQRIEWLQGYELTSCYLAMMPPYKKYTDSYFTDLDEKPKDICFPITVEDYKAATLFGKDCGLSFTMSVTKYPTEKSLPTFIVTDNGGNPYNKMYFRVCGGGTVEAGEIWESRTEYSIRITDDTSFASLV